jgi:hypothetical protein
VPPPPSPPRQKQQQHASAASAAAAAAASKGPASRAPQLPPAVPALKEHQWGEQGAEFKSGKFSKSESALVVRTIQAYAEANNIPVEVSPWASFGERWWWWAWAAWWWLDWCISWLGVAGFLSVDRSTRPNPQSIRILHPTPLPPPPPFGKQRRRPQRLCSENAHRGDLRGAWLEIARAVPHRTVQSIYRHGIRRLHSFKRGAWEAEEERRLIELVRACTAWFLGLCV